MSDAEAKQSSVGVAQMRRRNNPAAKPAVGEPQAASAAAAAGEGKRAASPTAQSVDTHRAVSESKSAPWTFADVMTVAMVVLAVATVVVLAPQFAVYYNTFTSQAAEHGISVNVFTFLKEQFYLLPLPGWDTQAAHESRWRRAQETRNKAQEERVNAVQDAVDAEFARLAANPSFTRYATSRIFFRPLPRKVYLTTEETAEALASTHAARVQRDDQGKAFVMTWGMAEVDPLTNTLDAARARQLQCASDGRTRMKVMRITTSMATGVRLYSSYTNVKGEKAEEASDLVARGACLARVMELMCVGDKWEIYCPPEMDVINATSNALEHRIDVLSVAQNVAGVADVEAELDYAVRQLPLLERAPHDLDEATRQEIEAQLDALPRMTRAELLRRVVSKRLSSLDGRTVKLTS